MAIQFAENTTEFGSGSSSSSQKSSDSYYESSSSESYFESLSISSLAEPTSPQGGEMMKRKSFSAAYTSNTPRSMPSNGTFPARSVSSKSRRSSTSSISSSDIRSHRSDDSKTCREWDTDPSLSLWSAARGRGGGGSIARTFKPEKRTKCGIALAIDESSFSLSISSSRLSRSESSTSKSNSSHSSMSNSSHSSKSNSSHSSSSRSTHSSNSHLSNKIIARGITSGSSSSSSSSSSSHKSASKTRSNSIKAVSRSQSSSSSSSSHDRFHLNSKDLNSIPIGPQAFQASFINQGFFETYRSKIIPNITTQSHQCSKCQ